MSDVEDLIVQLVAKRTGMPANDGTLDTSVDELGLTSLDFAEMLFEVEERFNVEVRLVQGASSGEGIITLRKIAVDISRMVEIAHEFSEVDCDCRGGRDGSLPDRHHEAQAARDGVTGLSEHGGSR
jgi:acyl carrier protein